MNKHIHRLVFDRRRGMRVPAAETARSAGKAAGGQTRATAVVAAGVLSVLALSEAAHAQQRGSAEGAVSRLSGVTFGTERVSAGVEAALSRGYANLPTYTADGNWKQNIGDYLDPTKSADGKIMTLVQKGKTIILNWDTFDIGQGYELRFEQKTGDRAFNRVYDINPSVINGTLTGAGEIVIENRNGVVFGPNARVQAGSLVATALQLTNDAFLKNFRLFRDRTAAFGGNEADKNGFIGIEAGAEIKALAGGDVIMVAPRIVNKGKIETPQGQTILAAGKTVYLYAPTDLAQRGLMVAVDNFTDTTLQKDLGTVVNEGVTELDKPAGTVVAERGTINLVGAAIRQKGRLTATTAINGENGAIYLQAMESTYDGGVAANSNEVGVARNGRAKLAKKLGVIELAAGSVTEVLPSAAGMVLNNEGQMVLNNEGQMVVADVPTAPGLLKADATPQERATYDAQKAQYEADLKVYNANTQKATDTFYRSRIDIIGADITLRSGSRVTAKAGEINVLAADDWQTSVLYQGQSALPKDNSLIRMESGAEIDASGLDNLRLPGSRHQLKGRLFSIELADSPVQRTGVLYRAELLGDARRTFGVGDVSGLYSNWRYTAAELSTEGGIVRMQSQGALDLVAGARIDFSGGSVVYAPVRVTTSLLSRDPSSAGFVRLDDADKGTLYSTLLSDPSKATLQELQRLGLTAVTGAGTNVPEVLVGKNAGAALLASPLMRVDAALNGSVVMSGQQRQSTTASSGVSVSNNGLSEQTDASHAIKQDPVLALKPNLYTTLRPSAGTLVLGKTVGGSDGVPGDYLGAAVRITGSGTSGMNEAGEFVLPASAIQGAGLGVVDIVAPAFNLGGSDGSSVSLAVVPGGRINVTTKGSIGLNGGLTATGGDIAITSILGRVDVAQGSSLSTKGTFRDERFERGAANEAVDLTAGSIKLSAGQGMSLNGVIDVSAGAWRATGGGSRKGDAGSVELSVNTSRPVASAEVTDTLDLGDARFAGYDFDNGGKVTIKGLPALVVGAPAAPKSKALSFNPADFARAGFGTIDISAIGDVTVADGAMVTPVLTNYVANRIARGANPLVNVVVQEAGKRSGVNLALTASTGPGIAGAVPDTLREGADLKVGTGATIDVGAGGSIALKAGGNLDMDGSLVARGGEVELAILGQRGAAAGTNSTDFEPYGYLKDQHIGLGENALIDVSGIVKSYRPGGASDARLFGEVLGGGTVTLGSANGTPQRGRLLMNAKASIKLDGASGDLDFGRFVDRQRVSAAAGTLNIGLTDGFELLGNLSAKAPDATVAGGTVNIALSQERLIDRSQSVDYPKDGVAGSDGTIPDNKRTIHLTGTQTQASTFASTNLKFGEGVVSAEALTTSGFDRISLRADHSVALQAGANLARSGNAPLQSVVLNAPMIDLADQGVHLVQANHVGMGVFSPAVIQRAATPQATTGSQVAAQGSLGGEGVLTLQAGLIEVSGDVAVKGANETTLDARLGRNGGTTRNNGEIRLIGAREEGTSDMTGRLSYAGSLSMRAGQLYATTLSDFTLKGFDSSTGDKSTLDLVAPAGGSTSQAPLSALASLTLDADTVTIGGNIHQPFGSIDIKATQLNVTEGGRLSVSGLRSDGSALIVPVGTTVNETQWVYATQGAVAASGQMESLDPKTIKTLKDLSGLVVDKRIALNGTTLKLDGKSQLDAQAGGDLLAWEFKAGVGGSTDTYNRKGVYAILPNNSYDFAPYDADINASSSKLGKGLSAGSQVTIKTGSSVLAAGTYTLMDARYGILPGAVLVRADSLATTADLPRAIANDDGSVFVSGFMGGSGTASSTGNPNMVLVLEPEDTFRKQSEVIRTSANAYVDALSKRSGEAILRPGDAGIASFVSTNAFDLLASVNLAGRDGLRGGMLDVAMPDMVVSRSAAPAAGKGQVSLDRLNSIGASSILLGGTRENSADGVTVTRKADAVSLVSTAATEGGSDELSTTGELLVVAKKSVKVDDGLRVASTGADTGDSRRYVIKGDGATLLVSNLSKTELSVTNVSATPSGDLEVGKAALPGSVQLSGNAVQLDATGNLSIDPNTRITTGSLGLGTQRVAVGANALDKLDANTLSISGELLGNINQSQRLQLRAYQGIDFYRDVTLGSSSMDKMTLDTPQLRGFGNADQVATVQAREVVLTNTTGRAAGTELGTSQLRIEATPVLQDGRTGGLTVATSLPSTSAVTANGQALAFAKTVLDSQGDIVLDGRGKLKAQGSLELSAARVTGTGKAQQVVDADGVLTITSREGAKTLGESLGAGGAVALKGARVEQRGVIDIESGTLDITGVGEAGRNDTVVDTVVFAEKSTTSVAGRSKPVSTDYAVSSNGGSISATATSGNVVFNGLLDASAGKPLANLNGNVAQAGSVSLKAIGEAEAGKFTAGAVVVGASGQIKLDAPAAAQGGKLVVDAQRVMDIDDAKAVAAGVAFTGSKLDALAKAAASTGQALDKVDIRVREGDVVLNTQLRANQVGITADGGKLSLGASGQVIADAAQGGLVQLQSKGDLTLHHGASISARSTREGANGGDVLLSSVDGTVFLGDAKVVARSEDDKLDGRIVVRAGRTGVGATDNGIKVSRLADDGNAATQLELTAGQVELVGVKVYADAAGTGDAQQHKTLTTGNTTATVWGLNTIKAEADAFLGGSNKANILSGLGLTSAQAHVKAEAEIRALGNFALDTPTGDFNFTPLVSGGEPINLTVRAAGNLSVVDSVSAGFGAATRVTENATAPSSVSAGDAASFRFVAGADTASANLLAVKADPSAGHFELLGDKHIRTTAGSIEVAAAGDVRLLSSSGNSALPSAIYVAGRLSPLVSGETFVTPYTWAQYTERGGRLSISAGGNVASRNATKTDAQSLTQMTPNFFFHAGATAGSVAWWTAFDSFRHGFGSFGGGNIDVTAGGDVRDMAVVSLTNARNVALAGGGTSLKELGGGDVSVQAGGDIAGGLFVLARGNGRLSAGGSITEGAGANTTDGTYTNQQVIPSAPLLGLMDGQWAVNANNEVEVSHVFNPTLLTQALTGATAATRPRITSAESGYYLTYAPTAGASVFSTKGNVTLEPNSQTLRLLTRALNNVAGNVVIPVADLTNMGQLAALLPPVMRLTSYSGDVSIDAAGVEYKTKTNGVTQDVRTTANAMAVTPSVSSDVRVYAANDLSLRGTFQLPDRQQASAVFGASPAAPVASSGLAGMANALNPLLAAGSSLGIVYSAVVAGNSSQLVSRPITDTAQADNPNVVTFAAGRDLRFDPTEGSATSITYAALRVPRPAELTAGRDLLNPVFMGQNFREGDVTRLSAGRDVVSLDTNVGAVVINGPGQLRVEAGRDILLQQSTGVAAVGNSINQALPDQGAKITLAAGMDRQVNIERVTASYGSDAAFRAELRAAVVASQLPPPEGKTSWAEATDAEVLSTFGTLTDARQVGALDRFLNARFVAQYLPELAGRSEAYYLSDAFKRVKHETMWRLATSLASQAVSIAISSDAGEEAKRKVQRQNLFKEAAGIVDLAGLGQSVDRQGLINLASARVHNLAPGGGNASGSIDNSLGGIDVIAADKVLVGLPSNDGKPRGFVNYDGGSFRSLTGGDFLAGDQKVIVSGRGNLFIYATDGDIDSGKGSNNVASQATPRRFFNTVTQQVETKGQPSLTGSGFQTIQEPADVQPRIGLYAPNGEIRALDAFIVGGDVQVAAPIVRGADNISNASGVAPPAAPTVTISIAPKLADPQAGVEQAAERSGNAKSRGAGNSQLSVELLGLGADGEAAAAGDARDNGGLKDAKDKDKEKR
ncbi:MAG: filamentous hemagglutinin family protein [Aquabacterium sp.]|uniref:filamentous haemagglutinin family protein n=1 Tax=Aquabacterium sp. TaxID=1872578 RepID=UPI001DC7DEDC|nr:filamentous haemagglutinin family protein [Aquabacterium sp.]MBT9609308.1 filamentous hemagglutinin family protein [Aquabacterium sp.]